MVPQMDVSYPFSARELFIIDMNILLTFAPLTVCIPGEQSAPIGAMPGCNRLGWRHGLIDEVGTRFFFLC